MFLYHIWRILETIFYQLWHSIGQLMSHFWMAKIGTMSLNWQKLFSTNYGTFQIDPKLAETAPLFCRVTDVPFLPKWCDALRRVIKEGYQHAGMDVDSANFRRGRTGGERRGRRPRS